jgi:hypothetical protein
VRRLRFLIASIAATAVVAPPASASDIFSVGVPVPGRDLGGLYVPANASGRLAVSFHGRGYSGVVTWRPGPGGFLSAERFKSHGKVRYYPSLILGEDEYSATAAHVQSASGSGGACGDARLNYSSPVATERAGSLTISLLGSGGDMLSTSCAGPLDGDLADVAPRVSMPPADVAGGERTIDLSGTHNFRSDGFTGVLTSTLVIHLGKPHKTRNSQSGPPPRPTTRLRAVSEHLTVLSSDGEFAAGFTRGGSTALCIALGSCAARGTLNFSLDAARAQGDITAFGPAKRPYRDFLKALGRSKSGNASGIRTFGLIQWQDPGAVDADLRQPLECKDSIPLGPESIGVTSKRGHLFAVLSSPGPLRTRCPGPFLPYGSIATGTLSPSSDGISTVTLRGKRTFTSPGYAGSIGGQLSLRIRRGRITSRTFVTTTGP